MAFEYHVVYLTALVRNCLDDNIDVDGICIVFLAESTSGEGRMLQSGSSTKYFLLLQAK